MVFKAPVGTVQQLIEARYGVRLTPYENPLITSVGVTPLIVFNNNPRRISFVIVNCSANVMYLSRTNAVAATNGIVLTANGGSVTMDMENDFSLPTLEWWIVAGGAASALYSISYEVYGVV